VTGIVHIPERERSVKRSSYLLMMLTIAAVTAVLGGRAITAQVTGPGKYAVQVPDGLSFSEFRGYESWQVVSVAHTDDLLNLVVANPQAIAAFQAGIPGNGQPFPDGAKLVKIRSIHKQSTDSPFPAAIPDALKDVGVMVKDTKRFADIGGWGYALFNYVAAADGFQPNGRGANCGVACHTIVRSRDYVFTDLLRR
jgi:hypothetical protein